MRVEEHEEETSQGKEVVAQAVVVRQAESTRFSMPMPLPRVHSQMDPTLIQAYRQAEYRVLGDEPMVLRIDVASAPLAGLHRTLNVDCSAFITAWNPLSQLTPASVNRARHGQLAADMAARGLYAIEAIGVDPAGHWPDEPGYLFPGLSEQDARQTGRRYGQNAVVWAGSEATPRLILLR